MKKPEARPNQPRKDPLSLSGSSLQIPKPVSCRQTLLQSRWLCNRLERKDRSRIKVTQQIAGTQRHIACRRDPAMAVSSKLQAFWNHPAGPKTIHFWAPTFKWGLSIANAADFTKPPESISYPQQCVVACSGLIWSRYSTQIKPKNLNLVCVNMTMAGTGIYQLLRKWRHDQLSKSSEVVIGAQEEKA